jgi:hypothetical protein
MSHPYLIRLHERRATLQLKRQIVLGLVGGSLLITSGAFRWIYVSDARTSVACALTLAGAALLGAALLYPSGLRHPESVIRNGTSYIGKSVFAALLSAVYFLVITPVGLIWRMWRGSAPFHQWKEGVSPSYAEGWTPKNIMEDERAANRETLRRPLLTQPFIVIGYFVRHGHYVLLPIVIVLLVLGLILFFVKASALAPFIYTLF